MASSQLTSGTETHDAPASVLLASIVITTYRRPDMLGDLLPSVHGLRTPDGVSYEVLVIDNDPAASARSLVEEACREWGDSVTLRYIHETRTGLSFARNRGIEESRGDVIAFLDDDMILDANWLAEITACLVRTGADCVGGNTVVRWEDEPEDAVRVCERQISGWGLGDEDFHMRDQRLPGGGNAAFRRSVFDGGLRFSTDLGRTDTLLLSDEDSELMLRLRESGKDIWYCAGAIAHHRTGGERLTGTYYVRLGHWYGISRALTDLRLYGRGYQFVRALARTTKALLVDGPHWLLGWGGHLSARQLLATCSLAKQWGYVRATLWGTSLIPAITPRDATAKETVDG